MKRDFDICPCGSSYFTEQKSVVLIKDAQDVAHLTENVEDLVRRQRYVYRCVKCGGVHLTKEVVKK